MRVNYQILLKLGDKWKDISGKKLILASAPGIPKKNLNFLHVIEKLDKIKIFFVNSLSKLSILFKNLDISFPSK